MPRNATLPTPFESLAAICKFIAIPKINPAFYAKHRHPVDFANAFLRVLANSYPPIEKAFRTSLSLILSEGAKPIHEALITINLTEEKLQWLDDQMTEVLRMLLPVVRDSELPEWLSECKWAVESAFDVK